MGVCGLEAGGLEVGGLEECREDGNLGQADVWEKQRFGRSRSGEAEGN